MDKAEITVIGAGVVGLAVASKLSKKHPSLIIAEKNESFGRETSSRNSEVVHSGIYYPKGTFKQLFCVRGNELLYAYLRRKGIGYSASGKLVVASNENEKKSLVSLKENGDNNGVRDLKIIERSEIKRLVPDIEAVGALYVPSAGILDSHGLMESLLTDAKRNGAAIAYDSEVCAVNKARNGYMIRLLKDSYEFETKYVINCSGLSSERIARLCGVDTSASGYRLYYSKGQYFRATKPFNVNMLVYPIPEAEVRSLGIHITPDLRGSLRFGPDAVYVNEIDYSVDETKKTVFAQSLRTYLPGVSLDDLAADTAGVRPKLQAPNGGFRDFVIKEESSKGFPGLINLIGIESPGLTSCLAIAEHVERLLDS